MANMQSAESVSFDVASASVIRQYRFVHVTAANQVGEMTSVNGVPVGVSLDASASGDTDAIPVAILNGAIIKVEAGGTVPAGAVVTSDTQGRAVNTQTNTSRGVGVAKTGGSSGEIIEIVAGTPAFASNA